MEKIFNPGDKVMIKSEGECIRGKVVEVTDKQVTVQLEELSHTVVIATYQLETLHLCED